MPLVGGRGRIAEGDVNSVRRTLALMGKTESPVLEMLEIMIGKVSSCEMANGVMRDELATYGVGLEVELEVEVEVEVGVVLEMEVVRWRGERWAIVAGASWRSGRWR
jgi:hypothetical protein